MRVAALHFAPMATDRAGRRDEAAAAIAEAARQGAAAVLLPELFAWPYFASDDPAAWRADAEPADGRTAAWASALASGLGLSILAPVFLEDGDSRRSNAVLLASPDGTLQVVARKIHLPPSGPGGFGEADHFLPGAATVPVFDLGDLRAAVLVCYDRRFPECWRAAREGGADVVFVPVAGPADEPSGFFAAELQTHARENGLWAVSASRAGTDRVGERDVRHAGDTLVVAPDGGIRGGRCQSDAAGLVFGDLDRGLLASCRTQFPLFEQKRAVTSARLERSV